MDMSPCIQLEVPAYIRENLSGTLKADDATSLFYCLYSNYDIRYVHGNDLGFVKEYFIGRGSHVGFRRVESHTLDKNIPSLLTIGRMCNFGRDCTILVDGEHKNEAIMNIEFMQFPLEYRRLRNEKKWTMPIKTKGKIVIGSGVVICNGATILSGVTIGDGSVIGADSVVTKDVPPYAVAAGNPAKVISYRFDERTVKELVRIRWWDFEHNYLFSTLPAIQNMDTDEFIENFGDINKNIYDDNKHNFVFSVLNERNDIKCTGCDFDGEFVPIEKLNETIQFYINQVFPPKPEVYYVVHNILDCRQ